MKYQFDPKAGIILVKTKVYGPRGDAIVNLALDTGAPGPLSVSISPNRELHYAALLGLERICGTEMFRARMR